MLKAGLTQTGAKIYQPRSDDGTARINGFFRCEVVDGVTHGDNATRRDGDILIGIKAAGGINHASGFNEYFHGVQTQLPFEVNGATVWLIDDVLYTGRTIRAVLNELFDYGRPAAVKLAVLVDRGQRELPVEANVAIARAELPATQLLELSRTPQGQLTFDVEAIAD